MDFDAAMEYILGRSDYERQPSEAGFHTGYNLERVYRLMAELGNPQSSFKSVHVAGTKGKGSTAAMISSVLSFAGLTTGLFSSPHLHTFRERIRVDGDMIGEDELADIVANVAPCVDKVQKTSAELGSLTTFEVTTAIAFHHFARHKVDVAVIEAGLGGRLDATNVVQPLVSVLTAISLDHMQILGGSVAEIAGEKAGIIKPGGIVVSAPQVPDAARVIRRVANERGARLLVVGSDWLWREDWNERGEPGYLTVRGLFDRYSRIRVPLLGAHQVVNAVTAVAALECLRFHDIVVTSNQIREGISRTKWPGRLEMVSWTPRVLVDGAHNADSMARLREALEDLFHYRRLIIILGTSTDKDIAGIVRELPQRTHHLVLTRSRHPRSAPPSVIAEAVQSARPPITITDDVPTALEQALRMADAKDLIVATGSLFVVAEVREAFGLSWA